MPLRSMLAGLAVACALAVAGPAGAVTFNYDFTGGDHNSSDFSLTGNAFWATDGASIFAPFPNRLRLTSNGGGQNGDAWLNTTRGDGSQAWNAQFTFQITFGTGSGADGLGFLLQENGTSLLTGWNGGGGLSNPSLAVSIDTFDNGGEGDFHLEVLLDGVQVGGNINLLGIGNSFDDVYQVVMGYDGAGTLGVNVVNTNGGANTGTQNFAADLTALNNAVLGWAASTGGFAENHDIRTFGGTFAIPEPGTALLLAVGLIGLAHGGRRRS